MTESPMEDEESDEPKPKKDSLKTKECKKMFAEICHMTENQITLSQFIDFLTRFKNFLVRANELHTFLNWEPETEKRTQITFNAELGSHNNAADMLGLTDLAL